MPAWITLDNGGELVSLVPTRYPGSEGADDGLIRMSRKTEWVQAGDEYRGLGQRLLATDKGELPLMDVRDIALRTAGKTEEQASRDA